MTRRLVVCCDGTWNRPDEMRSGAPAPTNVAKVALGLARESEDGTEQVLFYQKGVGTRRFERLRGGAFGVGLGRNVRECYAFLAEAYQPGDELYFFGFSRGAFTARSTVGLVRKSGVLRPGNVNRVNDAYRLYRERLTRPNDHEAQIFRRMYSHPEADLKFVGVWDTVGALGIPIDGVRLPGAQKLWGFHDTVLSSHVRYAYQALAVDERRRPFRPTLWQQQASAIGQTLEQVWFSGVHSDVGGGYPDPELAEISLLWMVERARACGLAFEPDHFKPTDPPIESVARQRGAAIGPNALGLMHESRKAFYRLQPSFSRKLADPDGSNLTVASSAARRFKEQAGYQPSNLEEYLAAGGPVTPVTDPTTE